MIPAAVRAKIIELGGNPDLLKVCNDARPDQDSEIVQVGRLNVGWGEDLVSFRVVGGVATLELHEGEEADSARIRGVLDPNGEFPLADLVAPRSATVSVEPAVRIFARDGYEYAILRFSERTGHVEIESSFGNWGFSGFSLGGEPLGHFLARLDSEYMGKKFLGERYKVVDVEASVEAFRAMASGWRRTEHIDEDEEDHELALLDEVYDLPGLNAFANETILDTSETFGYLPAPCWVSFWSLLWVPHIVPELKKWPEDPAAAKAFEAALPGATS